MLIFCPEIALLAAQHREGNEVFGHFFFVTFPVPILSPLYLAGIRRDYLPNFLREPQDRSFPMRLVRQRRVFLVLQHI
jgi:hypothetical protein